MMRVFCERLKLGSTTALHCGTGQNKGRYCKNELLFLIALLHMTIDHLKLSRNKKEHNDITTAPFLVSLSQLPAA